MRAHVVGRGEDLASIAARLGFDPETVWMHERNRALRERRRDPAVLAPGDVLYVPRGSEAHARGLLVERGATNRYGGALPGVRLRVVLRACGGGALPNEPYRLEGLRAPRSGVSDGSGVVDEMLPAHVREVRLVVPRLGASTALGLGALDPVELPSGALQRLIQLGYLVPRALSGGVGAPQDPPASVLRHAVRRFQREHALPATGELDAVTREALLAAHGA
jgi:peptidoglycan hydrolase-like protein with peptidoglycan-binding domain